MVKTRKSRKLEKSKKIRTNRRNSQRKMKGGALIKEFDNLPKWKKDKIKNLISQGILQYSNDFSKYAEIQDYIETKLEVSFNSNTDSRIISVAKDKYEKHKSKIQNEKRIQENFINHDNSFHPDYNGSNFYH